MLEHLQPLRDQIVVRLLPQECSALIPEAFRERSRHGEVMSVGPGKMDLKRGKRMPMQVKVGDRVMFSLNDFEDGEYTLIQQADIFGTVNA